MGSFESDDFGNVLTKLQQFFYELRTEGLIFIEKLLSKFLQNEEKNSCLQIIYADDLLLGNRTGWHEACGWRGERRERERKKRKAII